MTGLILKDIYTMLKQTKLFFLIAILMGFLQNEFLLSYIICYASMLPIAALGYDERAKWNKFANMLPYTINELVGCKYMVGYLSVGTAAVITACIKGFYTLTGNAAFSLEYWIVLLLTVCAALIIQAISLPFMFWLGVERGRLLFVLLIIMIAVSATTILDTLNFSQIQTGLPILISAVLAVTIIINLISFCLSRIAYQHS